MKSHLGTGCQLWPSPPYTAGIPRPLLGTTSNVCADICPVVGASSRRSVVRRFPTSSFVPESQTLAHLLNRIAFACGRRQCQPALPQVHDAWVLLVSFPWSSCGSARVGLCCGCPMLMSCFVQSAQVSIHFAHVAPTLGFRKTALHAAQSPTASPRNARHEKTIVFAAPTHPGARLANPRPLLPVAGNAARLTRGEIASKLPAPTITEGRRRYDCQPL